MNETLRRNGIRLGVGFALLAGAGVAGVLGVACQNTGASGTGGGSGSGGAGSTTTSTGTGTDGGLVGGQFKPEGCGFTIAPRPEYLSFALQTPVVGASSPFIERVRLGLGGNVAGTTGRADPSTSIAMAWQTDEGTDASVVQWGTGTDPTQWPAANQATGVVWDTPPGSLEPAGPEHMHEVYVCGLKPATTYSYRVGGGPAGKEMWSDVYTFTTTPAAGPSPVTFLMSGDARGEYNNAWQILQRHVHTMTPAPTLQIFSGDMINLAPDQAEWDEWVQNAWKNSDGTYLTLPSLLTLSAHGNHDNHVALFYSTVVLPQDNANAQYAPYGELFYSMDVGPVHVIVMDDFWVATPSGDSNYQGILQSWLTADLTAANANRANVPWIITVHHEPEYSSSLHGMDPDVLLVRQFFAPIAQQFHVDMAFAGHDHDYERSYPLNISTDLANPTQTTAAMGTTFVVCAGAGADGYNSSTSTWTATSANFASGGAIGIYSVLTADAHNLTLTAHYLEPTGTDTVFDTSTITK